VQLHRPNNNEARNRTVVTGELTGWKSVALKRVRTIERRRFVRLEVTTEGHAVAMHMPAIFTGVLDELLSGFMPKEVDLFNNLLRRALANRGELLGITRDAAVNSAGFPEQQIAAQSVPRLIHGPRVER
jgi:hypothetical protein